MIGAENIQTVTFVLDYDPGADDVIPLMRAPRRMNIVGAYATTVNDVAASSADYFTVALRNGGTAGTATDEIAAAVGGTAGWTGNTPKAFDVADGDVAEGEIIQLVYDEEGAGTFTAMVIQIDYVLGIGPN